LNRLEEIPLVRFAVNTDEIGRVFSSQILNALTGLEMELAPEPLTCCIHKGQGVATIAIHVAVTGGQTAIAKQNCDLVQRLRVQ
jgi:hypothetical protein